MSKAYLYCAPIALTTFIVDQLCKWWLLEVVNLPQHAPIIITPYFSLVMVWNTGISFGMLAGENGGNPGVLIAIALSIVAMLLWWLKSAASRWNICAVGLVVGGALGNVVDRVRFGAVADFFDVHAAGWYWPAFNIADSTIFIGVVMLCIDSLRKPQGTHHA